MINLVGLGVLAVTIAITGWVTSMALRVRRQGSLLDTMARTTFLPEKRRRYLLLISIQGGSILGGTIVWSLGQIGLWVDPISDAAVALFLAVGVGCVAAITWLGLRPGRISESERQELRREVPEIRRSLAFLPLDGDLEPVSAP